MIITTQPAWVCSFLKLHNQHSEHPEVCQTFGYVNEQGEMLAALAYHHSCSRSVLCDIAVATGWLPKKLLHIGLWYPFSQLKVKRLTFYVSATNLKSISLVEGLGAIHGATLVDGCSEGDVYIYYLLPDKCPIWSKFNGKISRYPGSA